MRLKRGENNIQQAVRLGGRHNMPPPRPVTFDLLTLKSVWVRIDAFVDDDDSFCLTSLLISVMMSDSSHCQNRTIYKQAYRYGPEIQIYTNIFKFQTGVLCYNKEI